MAAGMADQVWFFLVGTLLGKAWSRLRRADRPPRGVARETDRRQVKSVGHRREPSGEQEGRPEEYGRTVDVPNISWAGVNETYS
jgi:hypothetical protein